MTTATGRRTNAAGGFLFRFDLNRVMKVPVQPFQLRQKQVQQDCHFEEAEEKAFHEYMEWCDACVMGSGRPRKPSR